MKLKLLIHDLSEDALSALNLPAQNYVIVSAKGKIAPCQGCLGCWLKTPGQCVIKDEIQHIGGLLGTCEETVIISENWYGGYSADVKKVLDRSISTSLPFFTYRGGRSHHRLRYSSNSPCKVILYGNITDGEKAAARMMAEANRNNWGRKSVDIFFAANIGDIGGMLA